MGVRRVLRMGHPLLRQVAQPVAAGEIGSPAMQELLVDMVDTLHDYGGIGLAAPQIGHSLRLAIIEIAGGPTRYGELAPMPLTVFVNPRISILDATTQGYWEGCLSVPGLRGFVERPRQVRIDFTDGEGQPGSLELAGFQATVFQHEFDHLDGKLFVDRVADTRLLAFEREFERFYHQPEGEEPQ